MRFSNRLDLLNRAERIALASTPLSLIGFSSNN